MAVPILAINSQSTTTTPAQRVRCSGTVRFEVQQVSEISNKLLEEWSAIRRSAAVFRSPFFGHQFVRAVSRRVGGVEVALATRGGETIGVFPFQRSGGKVARPVGLGINDAHGLIAEADSDICLLGLMRACGIHSFPFHAAPPGHCGTAEFEVGRTLSFLADLTVDPKGYEHFLRTTSQTIDRQGQKTRRLVRELGPLRFEFDCREPSMLQHLLDLKSAQYRRTHIFDIFRVKWIRQLLQDLHRTSEQPQTARASEPPMRGILNVLYAGDTPVALHYGLVEGDLLHYWFPVFDPRFAYGSPGTQLFLEVARRATELGYKAIDMGYGEQPYKFKLTNVITEASYGIVDENPLRKAWYRNKISLRDGLKKLRLKDSIKPFARRLLPELGKGKYEA